MKNIFVVLSLLGAALAFPSWNKPLKPSFPWKIGSCKFNTYQENFKPELFFTGKWHELKSFGNLLEYDGTCGTMESKISGQEIEMLSYQYEPMVGKYMNIRGITNLTEIDKSSFKVKYDFMVGLTSINVPFIVLGTDYDNYAVVYSCQEAFGLVAEMGWISTRKPGDLTHEEEIKQVVDLARLNYSNFKKRDALNCPKNPPEL